MTAGQATSANPIGMRAGRASDAPKLGPPPSARPGSDKIIDKMMEKQRQQGKIVDSGWPGKCLTGTLALF